MKGVTVIAAIIAALLLSGAAAADAAPQGDGAGKALFEAKCSVCHGLDRPLGKTKDREGWNATVKRMQQVNGCRITDAEATEIIDYLVKVRGKGP